MKNKLPDHIPEELSKAGATLLETGFGGKHPYIRFQVGNITRKFCFAGTASDHRSMMNNRHELRRLLRRLKAEEAEQQKKGKAAA